MLHGYPWADLEAAQRSELVDALAESPLVGVSPSRAGLVDCHRSSRAIVGSFYQEWQARLTTYDEEKEAHTDEVLTSERQAFFVDLGSGVAGLQARNFPSETGLSASTARTRFLDRVVRILAAGGLPGVWGQLLKAEETISKDRVWSFMTSQRVVELRVTGIAGSSLDPDKPVFNPDYDANQYYDEMVFVRTSQHVEGAEFRASENGNLGQVREARAYVAAGDTQKIVYETPEGIRRTEQTWNGRIDAELRSEPEPTAIDEMVLQIRGRIPDNVGLTINLVPNPGTQDEMAFDVDRD